MSDAMIQYKILAISQSHLIHTPSLPIYSPPNINLSLPNPSFILTTLTVVGTSMGIGARSLWNLGFLYTRYMLSEGLVIRMLAWMELDWIGLSKAR